MAHCMVLGIDAYDVGLEGWRQGQGQTSCGERLAPGTAV